MKSRWKKILLYTVLVVVSGILISNRTPSITDKEVSLFATQLDDNLRAVFTKAISSAEESVDLYLYSLTDRHIIGALNHAVDQGIRVTICHDTSTNQLGYEKLSNKMVQKKGIGSGIMHKKILIIDQKKVYLGSANFTTSSLLAHDNLVIGLASEPLAKAILNHTPEFKTTLLEQTVEWHSLPENNEKALERLVSLIETAQKSVKVAMFTWTHPSLANAIIGAHKRGLDIDVVIDTHSGLGASSQVVKKLQADDVPVAFCGGSELCHHKMAIIDEKILIVGSANWTRSAFSKNDDCFVVVHDLTQKQQKRLAKLWYVIRCMRQAPLQKTVLRVKKEKSVYALCA